MKDEKHEAAPQSDVDGALFDYLNDMLRDPAAGKFTSIAKPRFTLAVKSSSDANVKPGSSAAKPVANVRLIKTDKAGTDGRELSSVAGNQSRQTNTAQSPAQDLQRAAWLAPGLLSPSRQAPELQTPEISVDATESEQAGQLTEAQSSPQIPFEADLAGCENSAADQQIDALPEARPWCENGRPEWAQQAFECLIFTVNGLKLAVPLITLGSIQTLDKKLTSLPGQPGWFMGILPATTMGNLKVLDTALCVMPERYQSNSRDNLHYVITIHGCAWGLACDSVEKSITLHPDQVKWRSQRGKRPWLAGTVVEYMCSLVDTDGFHEFLI